MAMDETMEVDASTPAQPANQSGDVSRPMDSAAVDSTLSGDGANAKDTVNQMSLPVSFRTTSDFNTSASMLGKGWEEYKGMQFDSFKRFFGNESHTPSSDANMSELKDMILDERYGRYYTPLALRHTHSTPLKKAPSILDEYAMRSGLPPPIPLDPCQRSSSTPSAFRTRSVTSAFGSVRSASPANTEETSSLAGVQYVGMSDEPAVSYRCSAFDPVQYYARQLEDMAVQEDMERTVIEVTDAMTSSAEVDNPKSPTKRRPKRGAAVAERFLANVRGLRRRRRGRTSRTDTIRSSASSHGLGTTDAEDNDDDDESVMSMPPQTTVTIITETGSVATGSRNSELSAILKHSSSLSSSRNGGMGRPSDQEEPLRPAAPTYHRLDSDAEEDLQYQKIEAFPSLTPYQSMGDDRGQQGGQGDQVSIQVSGKRTPPTSVYGAKENTSPVLFNSPGPTRVSRSLDSALTQRSNDSVTDSPQTNRSSNTGSSMGHTTQATSCSSIQQSNLSTISETDREVMLANKEGKRRRGLDRLRMHSKQGIATGGTESVNSSSTNSNSTSTNPHGYLALQGSPSPREGANVAMDSFFVNGGGNPALQNNRVHSLGNSSSSRRSGRSSSPVTDVSSAMTHTSSSSSSRSEPPTFVSYLDRKNASDLTSTREEMETCDSRSNGVDKEEREGSPAPIVEYQPMYFEEAALLAPQQVPKPVRPPSRPDKFRSRPPRSPMKGSRMITTPPPCRTTSPLYQQLSPPRHIVDQQPPTHQDNLISQPYVLRTTRSGKNLVLVGDAHREGHDDEFGLEVMHGVTYEENAIEIMNSDSSDDLLPTM